MYMQKPSRDAVRDVTINDKVVDLNDAKVLVREILNAAGLTPASEFQTVLVEKGRTHLLALLWQIDLREAGRGQRHSAGIAAVVAG